MTQPALRSRSSKTSNSSLNSNSNEAAPLLLTSLFEPPPPPSAPPSAPPSSLSLQSVPSVSVSPSPSASTTACKSTSPLLPSQSPEQPASLSASVSASASALPKKASVSVIPQVPFVSPTQHRQQTPQNRTTSHYSYSTYSAMPLAGDDNDRGPHDRLLEAPAPSPASRIMAWCSPQKLKLQLWLTSFCWRETPLLRPGTYSGAFLFVFYHVVFCLANGSSIIRPHYYHHDYRYHLPDDPHSSNNITTATQTTASTSGGADPILGIMVKWTAIGIVGSAPFLTLRLGKDIPALYPSIALFLAPFLAQIAMDLDDQLVEEYAGQPAQAASGDQPYPLECFLATFAVVSSLGMLLSGAVLHLSTKVQLANVGNYLPFSVMSGFFSSVGVMMWSLAFSVDTGGKAWKAVLLSTLNAALHGTSQEWHVKLHVLSDCGVRHIPSLVVGILMQFFGNKHPQACMMLILATILVAYSILWITGTSLQQAQDLQWFWSSSDLSPPPPPPTFNTTITDIYTSIANNGIMANFGSILNMSSSDAAAAPAPPASSSSSSWKLSPPLPFASLLAYFSPNVKWYAVVNSFGTIGSMAFLNLLRSSIHATALKKNVENLVRKIPIQKSNNNNGDIEALISPRQTNGITNSTSIVTFVDNDNNENAQPRHYHRRLASEDSIEALLSYSVRNLNNLTSNTPVGEVPTTATTTTSYIEIRPKPPSNTSAEDICREYGYSMYLVALVGGFGMCPINAVSTTMYAMGADGVIPQLGSVLLLLLVYLTDFSLVQYIPKAAFSSLLVLGAVEILAIYFVKSFQKTQDWIEWIAVPVIVIFSITMGFVQSIFLGLIVSLFLFMASFWRAGVVKYHATAMEVRSRIERSMQQSQWLDSHGDQIQVVVLQNYLFFGNARSVLNYVTTMFEDTEVMEDQEFHSREQIAILPMPKIVIIDLSLVSGADTSAFGIFAEIRDICKSHDCKLFLSGVSARAKKGLALAGVAPEVGAGLFRKQRMVRFFRDLDFSLGKAEDMLLDEERPAEVNRPPGMGLMGRGRPAGEGFQHALRKIDELHGQRFALYLGSMEQHVIPIELSPGDRLFTDEGGVVAEKWRGLFFIEYGELRVERDVSMTVGTIRSGGMLTHRHDTRHTLRHEHGRIVSMARRVSLLEQSVRGVSQNFRVMRLGPGWVLGTVESALGHWPGGITVAASPCRLHLLSFSKLQELEVNDPKLVVHLYKMLTYLMARKEVVTIDHLHTFHNIFNS